MDANDTQVLMVAGSSEEAQVVLALLTAEGIRAFVDGEMLQDEFAVSQRALGGLGMTIEVRVRDHERATAAIARARADGRAAAEEDDEAAEEDDERPSRDG